MTTCWNCGHGLELHSDTLSCCNEWCPSGDGDATTCTCPGWAERAKVQAYLTELAAAEEVPGALVRSADLTLLDKLWSALNEAERIAVEERLASAPSAGSRT